MSKVFFSVKQFQLVVGCLTEALPEATLVVSWRLKKGWRLIVVSLWLKKKTIKETNEMDRMEIFSFHLRCRSSDSSILSSVDVVVERTEEALRTKRPATRYLAFRFY